MNKGANKIRRAGGNVEAATSVPVPPGQRPRWLSYTIGALAAGAIFSRFWFGIGDPDFWWHLKTGQYIWQNHKLPVPDPFAYTTYLHADSYAGESLVRYFNLTHEWLAQLAYYGAYSLAGPAGVAALRALLLTMLCGTIGLIVWRRTSGFYRSVAAALVAMACCTFIASERPYLFTYFLLTALIAMLEYRRWADRRMLWVLPLLFLAWANLHGAYFLGWVVLAAYCGEALVRRWRGRPDADERSLFLCAGLAVLASGINPNGFHIVQTLLAYRNSPLQTSITEWQRPKYWEASTFTAVLYAAFAALLWARRRARVSDWLLFILFAAAALTAVRNIILVGIVGPIIIGSYLPSIDVRRYLPARFPLPTLAGLAAAFWLVARIAIMPHPSLDAADWRFSAGAADFLLAHHVTARLFNSYESGGYLMWRLWPQNQVFIDGRALSEAAFADYKRIAFNADSSTGPSAEELLARYGVGAIVMPMIDYSGKVYLLPAALSDPSQREWKLVYADRQAVIYVKTVPDGVTALAPNTALGAMEAQCNLMLDISGDDCARGVANLYAKIGDRPSAARWMSVYQSRGGPANAQFEGLR